MTKHRARQEIMHYVFEFCITRYWPDMEPQKYYPSIEGFTPASYGSRDAQIGDLVILSATRRWSKWQIGWLVEIDANDGWPRYLIESLEDESLGWWENVGLNYFNREKIGHNWRWDDRKFAFSDRWNRVCFKEKDAYIVLPRAPVFGEGYSVTLGTRTRFGFDEATPERHFPDWRKVTRAMMAQVYDECVAERDLLRAQGIETRSDETAQQAQPEG